MNDAIAIVAVHGLDGGIQPCELAARHERERGLHRDRTAIDAHETEPHQAPQRPIVRRLCACGGPSPTAADTPATETVDCGDPWASPTAEWYHAQTASSQQ